MRGQHGRRGLWVSGRGALCRFSYGLAPWPILQAVPPKALLAERREGTLPPTLLGPWEAAD